MAQADRRNTPILMGAGDAILLALLAETRVRAGGGRKRSTGDAEEHAGQSPVDLVGASSARGVK